MCTSFIYLFVHHYGPLSRIMVDQEHIPGTLGGELEIHFGLDTSPFQGTVHMHTLLHLRTIKSHRNVLRNGRKPENPYTYKTWHFTTFWSQANLSCLLDVWCCLNMNKSKVFDAIKCFKSGARFRKSVLRKSSSDCCVTLSFYSSTCTMGETSVLPVWEESWVFLAANGPRWL